MKTLVITLFLFISFSFHSFAVNVLKAIEDESITVISSFRKLGSHGMILTIQNNTSKSLKIEVPSGTTFHPKNKKEQIIVNLKYEEIVLEKEGRKAMFLAVYCMERYKAMPSRDAPFSIGQTNDKRILRLLDFLNEKGVSQDNFQNAIWAVTDMQSISYIHPRTIADKEVRAFIAKLTEREDPWHYNENSIQASYGELIQTPVTTINGELEIKPEEEIVFLILVYDKEKNVMINIPNELIAYKNIENTFQFSLEIRDWEKGDYKVVFKRKSDNSELATFPFEI